MEVNSTGLKSVAEPMTLKVGGAFRHLGLASDRGHCRLPGHQGFAPVPAEGQAVVVHDGRVVFGGHVGEAIILGFG
jgi:hypothetical protein